MATELFEKVPVELADGTEVVLQPLPIARLRKFMAAWRGMEDVEKEEDTFDVFINCAGISLAPQLLVLEHQKDAPRFSVADATESEVKKKKHLNDDYKAYLEDVVDVNTAMEVMKVCGGIDLKSPELLRATAEAVAEAGKTSTS